MTNAAQALIAVMQDVRSVAKKDRNTQQGFDFRGIDSVIDEVGPALRKHGVLLLPNVEEITTETYQTKGGTAMRNVTAKVSWTVVGPEGDILQAPLRTVGEAADSGDKAISKAQSVAHRIIMIQALCIPTGQPDPDGESHERATQTQPRPVPPPPGVKTAKADLWRLHQSIKPDLPDDKRRDEILQEFVAAGLDPDLTPDIQKLAHQLREKHRKQMADPWAEQEART